MSIDGNIELGSNAVRASLCWSSGPGVPDVDASALPLDAAGEVAAGADFGIDTGEPRMQHPRQHRRRRSIHPTRADHPGTHREPGQEREPRARTGLAGAPDTQPSTAVLMAELRRTPAGSWTVRAIGEFHDYRTVKKLVPSASRQVLLGR